MHWIMEPFSFELQCACVLVCVHMQVWCAHTCMCAEDDNLWRVISRLSPFQHVSLGHGHGSSGLVTSNCTLWAISLAKAFIKNSIQCMCMFLALYMILSALVSYGHSLQTSCFVILSLSPLSFSLSLSGQRPSAGDTTWLQGGKESCVMAHLCPSSLEWGLLWGLA